MTCALSFCDEPVRYRVRFEENRSYCYCDKHGWVFAKGARGTSLVQSVSRINPY